MNIKDLQPGSYKVVSSPTNINQLPAGSFKTVDPRTAMLNQQKTTTPPPKHGTFLQNVGNALISSEKTLGSGLSTVGSNIPKQVQEQGAQEGKDQQAIIDAIHKQTDPTKKQHLIDFLKQHFGTNYTPPTAGDINPGFNLSNKDVVKAAGGVALDVLGGASVKEGSVIKDAKALAGGADLADVVGKSGKLIAKSPELINAAEKVGLSTAEKAGTTAATKAAETKTTQAVWDLIKPELSKAERATALKEGKITTEGVLKTIKQIPKGNDLKMIEAAKPYVQGAKNEIEAVANMQKGIETEAKALRAGLDKSNAVWNQNTLKGAINAVEKPHLLTGDLEKSFQKTLNVVLDQAKGANKKLSGLLDVRQNFDRIVAEQYPNLYEGGNMTAIKKAVLDTRSAINKLIEAKLPKGVTADGIPFLKSLQKQSLLYDAIDNAASKAPQIGTNVISQWMKAHPLLSTLGKMATEGTAIGTGMKLVP